MIIHRALIISLEGWDESVIITPIKENVVGLIISYLLIFHSNQLNRLKKAVKDTRDSESMILATV